MIKKLLVIGFIVMLVREFSGTNSPVELGPGVKIPDEPIQKNIKRPQAFDFKGYTIIPLAEFDIKAKVLSRKNYNFGRESDLSPVDFTMGWGQMSDEAVLDQIDIKQSGRWYFWRVEQFPIPRKAIETQSANMHLIPADEYIENKLDDVRQGQLVHIDGYLIKAEASDGWHWQSSLTRNDTGNGGCEVIYVKDVSIIQ